MTEILNELSELVYISDLETYDLLFMNTAGKKNFGVSEKQDLCGKKCYEVLQRRTKPCPFCTNSKLSFNGVYEWNFFNPVTKRDYMLKDKLIPWKDGRPVRMEIALDISEIMLKHRELEKSFTMEHFINKCLRILHRSCPMDRNIQDILSATGEFFQSQRSCIFDIDFEDETVTNTYEWCAAGVESEIDSLKNVPLRVMVRWITSLRHNECVYIGDIENIKYSNIEEYGFLVAHGIKSLLRVPLMTENAELLGFIGVDNPVPNVPVSSIDFGLKALSYFLVSVLTKDKLEKQLEDMSFKDMLTGLQNRNKFINDIDTVQNIQNRHVGIAYVDMNGLKAINDSLGHEKGNEALQAIASRLLSLFRRNNLYRIGGDEFVVLCPEIPKDVFEKKIKELKEKSSGEDGGKYCVAVGHLWFEQVIDLKKHVRETDRLMYENKKAFYAADAPRKMPGETSSEI